MLTRIKYSTTPFIKKCVCPPSCINIPPAQQQFTKGSIEQRWDTRLKIAAYCATVQCSETGTVQCSTVRTVQCSAVQWERYSAVQYSEISTVKWDQYRSVRRLECSVVRKVEYIDVITVHYSEISTVQDSETNTVQCSEVLYTWSAVNCCAAQKTYSYFWNALRNFLKSYFIWT